MSIKEISKILDEKLPSEIVDSILSIYWQSKFKEDIIDELNNKSKLIQKKIALNLTSKFTPKLKFFFDNSFEYSNKINYILETINR